VDLVTYICDTTEELQHGCQQIFMTTNCYYVTLRKGIPENMLNTQTDPNQGRDSPIVKHYSKIKNPCFVTSVNTALCS
jgi:hypothetical protein